MSLQNVVHLTSLAAVMIVVPQGTVCEAGTVPLAFFDVIGLGSNPNPYAPYRVVRDYQFGTQKEFFLGLAGGGPKPLAEIDWFVENLSPGVLRSARTTYYFCVSEIATPPVPVSNVPVQIFVAGTARVTGSGRLRALAGVNILGLGVSERIAEARLNVPGRTDVLFAEFSETISSGVRVGNAFGIVLRAEGSISGSGTNFMADVRAVADPAVIIDPSFAYRDYYEVQFSDNLIPEPSTMSLAALALAWWRRVRRLGKNEQRRAIH
jgi:hypothetical protein